MTVEEERLSQIIFAMLSLGGECHYKDLYATMASLYPETKEKYDEISWQAGIRQTIEFYSSDSTVYKSENPDIFYSVKGIGKGYWGLRREDIEDETDVHSDDLEFSEGQTSIQAKKTRYRNQLIKTKAIEEFKKEHTNKLYCAACGFNFEEEYPEIGKGFIEMHHTKPLSTMKENEKTTLSDIVLLCSNCHRMIHRKSPCLSLEELRAHRKQKS